MNKKTKRVDLTGQIFKDFQVLEYIGNKKYRLKCLRCGEEKEVYTANILKGYGVTCSLDKPQELKPGDQFGEWTVVEYVGNKKYLCICSCGNTKEVLKCNLLNGSSTSCGHSRNSYGDLTGKQFGEWTVLGKENYLYKCRCSCGKIALIGSHDLVSGRTKSCGHAYNKFTDITGQKFGHWSVLEYLGNQHYKCQCDCENKTIRSIRKADLINGATTSCGCGKASKIKSTLIERYGEVAPNKLNSIRSKEQIEAAASKEGMERFIRRFSSDGKIISVELAQRLNLGLHRTLTLIHQYGLDDMVILRPGNSQKERELSDWIQSTFNLEVENNNRQILSGKEIDIYIPSKRIGIEFNGSYWHSYPIKPRKYHQDKTLEALKSGVRLIHIFEYEWDNLEVRKRIQNYLSDILGEKKVIYARNTEVKEISSKESSEFLDKYHLQESAPATVHIGCYFNNELVGVLTLGKPRFNTEHEYEIIRMCFKSHITVIGGAKKMFHYFIEKYKPSTVFTYSDIGKFTGNIYLRMGFKVVDSKPLTEPNYIWVNPLENKVLSRYQTMKQKLIELGYGDIGNTEDEIMETLGYIKIYDCGSIRLEYISK